MGESKLSACASCNKQTNHKVLFEHTERPITANTHSIVMTLRCIRSSLIIEFSISITSAFQNVVIFNDTRQV